MSGEVYGKQKKNSFFFFITKISENALLPLCVDGEGFYEHFEMISFLPWYWVRNELKLNRFSAKLIRFSIIFYCILILLDILE